jgi:hypothetical protein
MEARGGMIGLCPTLQEDSLSTALWLLVAEAGHHRCDGWTFEERDGLLQCACGDPLYEIRTVGRRGDSHARPGPTGQETADDAG